MLLYFIGFCFTFALVLAVSPQLRNEIISLPGQPPVSFKQYAGYIEINSTTKASIFYWFQVCEQGITQCPLFLWTNGGPGCSGIQAGLTEQGAFRIQPNGTLSLNDYRWNKYVNIVFIEQPIGVGFSTSNDPNDYVSGDEKSAKEMYQFILGFYKIFPELKSNDFYLSSESYGGHYAPMTAKWIADHDTAKEIPMKGFLVGNPLTDPMTNQQGRFGTFYGHQIISYPLFNKWRTTCDNGRITNGSCAQLRQQMNEQIHGIFDEGLDFPTCINASNWTQSHGHNIYNEYYYALYAKQRNHFFLHKVYYGAFGETKPKTYDDNPPYNCLKDYSAVYLNRKDVRNAMYVNPLFNGAWTACADIEYNASDINSAMQPVYQYLIASGLDLHMTIYSGDDDSVCSTMGDQFWIYNMSWTINEPWTAWYYVDGKNGKQVGGYYVKFKSAVNFITVHTAGHETPFLKPKKMELILQKYLANDI